MKSYRYMRGLFTGTALIVLAFRAETVAQLKPGAFEPTWESLKQYQPAQWFQDAKFGIFIHWGVYSVPAFASEWYPREMYLRGTDAFNHHVATYGSQSKFGYKDFIPMFKAEKWDPDHWAEVFKRAGAQYVVPVAEHHDGFAMYGTALSPWNATRMGPKRDIIGDLAKAVRKRGLTFGVSSHRAEHWWFMNGGVQFDSDVRDPEYSGLYGPARPDTIQPDQEYLKNWLARCKELVDKYQPQVFYFDWWIEQPAFAPLLQQFSAYYYNKALDWKREVVLNYKNTAFPDNTAVLDIERGRLKEIRRLPWQTDTSIGKKSWGYIGNEENKSAGEIVDILVDIVSKNGCLLLNIGPRADGAIPEDQEKVLLDMGTWLSVNGEAIYGTRPWEVFGEGITREQEGMFSEMRSLPYTAGDIRFTKKDNRVYAVCLDWPGESLRVRNLKPRANSVITLLGYGKPLEWQWSQTGGLHISLPPQLQREENRPCRYAYAFKVEGERAIVADKPAIRVDGKTLGTRTVFSDTLRVELSSATPDASLFYTLDGSSPTDRSRKYERPVILTESGTVKAVAVKNGFVESMIAETEVKKTSNVKSIAYKYRNSSKYGADGDLSLADAERGTVDYNDGKWLGFEGDDLEATIELRTAQKVQTVCLGCLEDQNAWIFLPTGMEVSASSDGEHFLPARTVEYGDARPGGKALTKEFCVEVNSENTRYVRVRAKNVGVCPPWHKSAGGKAWLFVDEIVLR